MGNKVFRSRTHSKYEVNNDLTVDQSDESRMSYIKTDTLLPPSVVPHGSTSKKLVSLANVSQFVDYSNAILPNGNQLANQSKTVQNKRNELIKTTFDSICV